MDRGIYAAASNGLLQSRHLDVIANNLANVNTVGFKAERIVSRQQEFADTLAGALSGTPSRARGDHERAPGVADIATVTDFSLGPVNPTGNPLNVALAQPNQFFVVSTPNGDQYTRAGNFTLDSQGSLVTADGLPVQGEGGPINLTAGEQRISRNGTVTVNGQTVGRLRTVEIEDVNSLRRQEGTRFSLEGAGAATAVPADLVPESVEMPNVGVVESMVNMIAAQRMFETYTKTMQTSSELNDTALRTARSTG